MPTMSTPAAFALAKIQPPRPRAGLVERPALEQALDDALVHHRLTLLLAPAGYGKSAALTRQIRRLPAGCALAWVSADEDDQLERFLACLATALEPHDLPWRVAPDALGTLAQAEHGLRDVATELVNALASAEVARGVIVLDDVHRIADPRVFQLLQALLDRLPERWSMAIASRVEPPLSLARWRASGELAEFRQVELRFSEAELGAWMSAAGLAHEPASVRELLRRTDGWAAGLRLTLAARPGAPVGGPGASMQRHLFDYLASEVLDDMPAALRRFLLRCSVLPELTAARCEHVSRIPQSARLLEEVERRGLFVATLEADELTLRLHDLFRDFLEDRLQRDYPGEMPYLLRRAADDEPDLTRAVGYLVRAGAWDDAARLLIERGGALVAVGGAPALDQMLAQLPAEQFERRPDLDLLRGFTAFPRFDFDGMVAAMERAAAGFARDGREQDAALARAFACVGMENTGRLEEAARELARLRMLRLAAPVRAFVCFGSAWTAYATRRPEEVAPHVAQMLDALESEPDPHAWDRCFFLSILAGLPGLRPLLERFAAGALRIGGDAPTQLHAGAMHARAWIAFGDGRIDEAAQWLARADDDVRWLGRPRSLMTENWMAHTLIDAVRGDRAAAYAAAQENHRDLQEHSMPSNRLTHEYEEIFTHQRAAWLLDDVPRLRALDDALARCVNAYEWPAAGDDRRFSRAFVALADGHLSEARDLLRPLAADVERSCFFPAMQARVMLADIELRLGAADGAAAMLRPWLDATHAGGEVGGALLAGLPALERLAAAAWGPRLSVRDRAVLQRLAGAMRAARGQPDAVPAAASALRPLAADLAALSEREREVLARMAAGDSNKLIARRFDLSPHTVKRHVANILDKLGASTRGQAAARWRQSA